MHAKKNGSAKNFVKEWEAEHDPVEIRRMIEKYGYTWLTAMFEFIDNSISAHGTKINIFRRGYDLIIRDNGSGIEPSLYKRLATFITNGKSRTSLLGKNGCGFKPASRFIAEKVTCVTKVVGGDEVVLTPIFDSEKVLSEEASEKIHKDEARELAKFGSGTSIILSKVKFCPEEMARLMSELEARIGFYYYFLMDSRKGWKGVDIRVEGKPVERFNPACPDLFAKRASKDDMLKVMQLCPRKEKTLTDGNSLVRCDLQVVHAPDIKLVKRMDKDNLHKIYPAFLMEDKISSGIYMVRYNRIQGVLSFDDVGIKTGARLSGCRVLLFLESDAADRAFFSKHINKTIRKEDISDDMKASIKRLIGEYVNESKNMRNESLAKRKSTREPMLTIKKFADLLEASYKRLVRKNTSGAHNYLELRKEVLKGLKVKV